MHLVLGLGIGIVGVIPPGLLNLTSAKISMDAGLRKASFFSLGASIVVIVQVTLGIFFSELINRHPYVISALENIAIFLFVGLSIFFFIKARMETTTTITADTRSDIRLLGSGIMLSALNIFPVPFYIAFSTYLATRGLFVFDYPEAHLFVIGAPLGTFIMLYIYARYVHKFNFNSSTFARKVNYLLSLVTLTVAIIAFAKKMSI